MARRRSFREIGMILLAIYLIIVGLAPLGISLGVITSVIALIAGILLLLDMR